MVVPGFIPVCDLPAKHRLSELSQWNTIPSKTLQPLALMTAFPVRISARREWFAFMLQAPPIFLIEFAFAVHHQNGN